MSKKRTIIGTVGAVTAGLALAGGFALAANAAELATVADRPAVAFQSAQGSGPRGGDDFIGSIEAPSATDDMSDQAEYDAIAPLVKISAEDAERAALAEVPGTVLSTQLEESEGYVVYEVTIRDEQGRFHDLTVDAGDSRILENDPEDDWDGDRD